MFKFRRVFLLLLVLVLFSLSLIVFNGCAQKPEEVEVDDEEPGEEEGRLSQPINIEFATFTEGTAWYLYGAFLGERIQRELPAGSRVDVLPLAGGTANAGVVSTGEADIGLMFDVTTNWAYNGVVAYEEAYDNLTVLLGGLDQYFIGVVTPEAAKINSIKDIAANKTKVNVYTNPPGGLGAFGGELVLNAYGITFDDIKNWGGMVSQTGYDAIKTALQDRKCDLHPTMLSEGHSFYEEIFHLMDLKVLPIEDDIRQILLDEYGLQPNIMPAGTYGISEDVPVVGVTTTVIARRDMPDEVAYEITRAIFEHADAFADNFATVKKYFKPEDAWRPEKTGSIPLHPGAERYFREAGLMK